MKLQRSTILLVAIALGLGGVVLGVQTRQDSGAPSAESSDQRPLFDFAEADVAQLQVEVDNRTLVSFERDADGNWQMTEPETSPAEAAAIAFLLSRLTQDGLNRTLTINAENRADFGLDAPTATVQLTLKDGSQHRLVLGGADFSGTAYYALIDPAQVPLPADAGEVTVALVSQNVMDGVDRPLEEWQAVVDEGAAESSTPVTGEGATVPAPDALPLPPSSPPDSTPTERSN